MALTFYLRIFELMCLLVAYLHGALGRADHNVPLQEVHRLVQLEADLAREANTGSISVPLQSIFQEFRRIVGDQVAAEDLLDHPVNLFVLYRHWSSNLIAWKRSYSKFPDTRVLELIELAPNQEDVQGSYIFFHCFIFGFNGVWLV